MRTLRTRLALAIAPWLRPAPPAAPSSMSIVGDDGFVITFTNGVQP